MKKAILSTILLGACAVTGSNTYIKENPILKRWNIIKDNRFSGYAERNKLLKNRIDVFDRTGKHKGHIKKNDLLDRWEFRKVR